MIGVDYQVNAVQRTLGRRRAEAGELSVLTMAQVYQAELAERWDACPTSERLPRWFLPVEGELRPGGQYQLTGNASGTVQRCDPPHSFATACTEGWAEADARARVERTCKFSTGDERPEAPQD